MCRVGLATENNDTHDCYETKMPTKRGDGVIIELGGLLISWVFVFCCSLFMMKLRPWFMFFLRSWWWIEGYLAMQMIMMMEDCGFRTYSMHVMLELRRKNEASNRCWCYEIKWWRSGNVIHREDRYLQCDAGALVKRSKLTEVAS